MFRNTNAVEAPFRADMHLLTAGKFRLMERQNRPRCDKAHVLLLPPGRRCIHGRARLHIDRHNEGLNCGFADGHARWLRGLNVPDSYNSGDAANYPPNRILMPNLRAIVATCATGNCSTTTRLGIPSQIVGFSSRFCYAFVAFSSHLRHGFCR